MRIHAWLEAREIAGLAPAFRGVVEVYRESAYVPIGGGGSPAELERLVDRVLVEVLADGDGGS